MFTIDAENDITACAGLPSLPTNLNCFPARGSNSHKRPKALPRRCR